MEKPISKDLINKWKSVDSETKLVGLEIEDRIHYILETWFETFGTELDYWYFDGAEENEVGLEHMDSYDEFISGICLKTTNEVNINNFVILDKYGNKFCLYNKFPTRWLYEDSVKEEIVCGKASYEEKKAE